MKKYTTPEMKALSFVAMEAISVDATESMFINRAFDWVDVNTQVNG